MIDIKFLRENPDVVKQNIKNKFQDQKLVLVDEVLEMLTDRERRVIELRFGLVTGKSELIEESAGDVILIGGWQPGVRVRCYKNLHLFLGPTIASDCFGFHVGVGF